MTAESSWIAPGAGFDNSWSCQPYILAAPVMITEWLPMGLMHECGRVHRNYSMPFLLFHLSCEGTFSVIPQCSAIFSFSIL